MEFLWLILGMCITIVIWNLYNWNQRLAQALKWWQWVIVGLWGTLLIITPAFIGTAYGEGEPRAAMVGGVMFSLITIVSGVGLWRWLVAEKGKVKSS